MKKRNKVRTRNQRSFFKVIQNLKSGINRCENCGQDAALKLSIVGTKGGRIHYKCPETG